MHLKSLTIRGFKSFADRTSLRFEPGITAIVGPNGSGKSNITDAVLWVLGEQSARSLRGSSMEDVIFAGSSNRPPLGLAEVTLCLDNSSNRIPIEFSEVTISRRVLRSGESEYRLNNSVCRLLDIQELLSDSGLGREMYSVVSQGKLEEILSSRPEERRTLIDEAAGILKYRRRKEKSLRKMSAIEQNLIRLKDIVREVEKQIRPLQNQANQAKAFNELSRELRDVEIGLAVNELKGLQASWEEKTGEQERLMEEITQFKGSLEEAAQKIRELRAELERRGLESGGLIDRNRELERVLERLRGSFSLLEEKERNVRERIAGLSEEDSDLKLRLAQKEKELSQSRSELKEVMENLGSAAGRLDTTREEISRVSCAIAEREKDTKGRDRLLIQTRERAAEKEKLLREAESKLASLDNEVSLLETRMQASRVRGEEARQLAEYKEKFLEAVTSQTAVLVEALRRCRQKNTDLVFGHSAWDTAGSGCNQVGDMEKLQQDLLVHFHKELRAIQARLEKRKEIDQAVLAKLEEKAPQRSQHSEEISSLKQEVDRLRSQCLELENSLSQSQSEEEEVQNKIALLRDDVNAWQVKVASLDERRNSLERLIGNQRTEVREIEVARRDRFLAIERLHESLKRLVRLKAPFNVLLRRVEDQINQLISSEKDEALAFGDIRQLIKEKEAAQEVLRERISASQENLHQVELSKAQLELKVQAAVQKIVEEYNLPLDRALEKYPGEGMEVREAEERASKLRARIAGLGPINPIAIEEYRALEERHNLLVKQFDDLSASRKMLFKILKEIDKKIEGTFLEAFQEVNANFQFLFSSLFPGGKAELTFTDPDNLLETGVEIEIYPDGKKAQKLTLLSGGERALVALALLFAIYLRRPSPFYILDEVEAALDDINIQRFVGLLSQMRDQSQFLIITHQKRTMEAANSLYGVTMQADGVSRLVSQKIS